MKFKTFWSAVRLALESVSGKRVSTTYHTDGYYPWFAHHVEASLGELLVGRLLTARDGFAVGLAVGEILRDFSCERHSLSLAATTLNYIEDMLAARENGVRPEWYRTDIKIANLGPEFGTKVLVPGVVIADAQSGSDYEPPDGWVIVDGPLLDGGVWRALLRRASTPGCPFCERKQRGAQKSAALCC